jgi:cell division protein FtsL
MTQYQHKSTPITVNTDVAAIKPSLKKTSQDIQRLEDRILQQEKDITDLRRVVKKLQNEMRTAINTFNSNTRG